MERYTTSGVCSRAINFVIKDNRIKDINFEYGCDGNLKGISALVIGMDIDDAIDKLSGITCGGRPTSCPDQLAKALVKYKEENNI